LLLRVVVGAVLTAAVAVQEDLELLQDWLSPPEILTQ
jgi:hypothetical protein